MSRSKSRRFVQGFARPWAGFRAGVPYPAAGGSAPAAAAVRDVASAQAGTATLPTRQAGDALLVAYISTAAMPAAQSGWTRVVNIASAFSSIGIYSKVSDGTDATPPIAAAQLGDAVTCAIAVSVSNPGTQVVGATATTLTAASVTAASGGVLLSFFGVYDGVGPTITKPAGQTLGASVIAQMFQTALVLSYETLAAGGATGTRVATPGGSYSELGAVNITR